MCNKINFLKNCLIICKQNEQGQRSGPRRRLYNTPVTTALEESRGVSSSGLRYTSSLVLADFLKIIINQILQF